MNYKQLLTVPVLGLALGGSAYAGVIPNVNSINGWPTPQSYDYSFDNRDLTVSVLNDGSGGYSVTASGSGGFTFYGPSNGNAYSGSGSAYSLVANFNSSSVFQNGLLTINGSLPAIPSTTGTPTGLLYSANLVGFGYDASQSAIAFRTQFNPSWSNQPVLTGGSLGEVVYLFDMAGLSGGYGNLEELISAVQVGGLGGVVGSNFVGVRSIATVPVPLPAVLFGTGLTALLGIGRKRRSVADAV